jgi:hypothetical protein
VEDNSMNSRQWNLMIYMVNDGNPRGEVKKHFSKEDMKTYDNMIVQLAKLREKDPNAAFSPVETDW